MVNEKIQNVLSRLEKDIDYENSHRDEVPSEKRLNCISKNIGMLYNTLLMSINAKKILEIGMSVGYSGLWFADAVMLNTKSDGQIITIDREQFKIDNATRNFEEAGVSSLIKIREGEARKILLEIKEEFGENYFDFIIFGSIHRSQFLFNEAINSKSKIIFVDGEDHPIIKEQITDKGIYFKRELISNNVKNVYPINFAIPKEKIIHTVNLKPLNVLAPLIPGKISSYIYKNEQDYYQSYQNSIFALTYKKVGWDSLRHYEILMNGCIPLFLNIDKCPERILTNLPKKLLFDIFNQYSWILNQFFPTSVYKMKFLSIENFFLYS